MAKINQIVKLEKTCESCPTQYEGIIKTPKGTRPLYIRYRWGYLSIRVGMLNSEDIMDAVRGIEVIGVQLGDWFDGKLEKRRIMQYIDSLCSLDIEAQIARRLNNGMERISSR